MKFVRRSDHSSIERLVNDLDGAVPTYSQIGATLNGTPPFEKFRHEHYKRELGSGESTFTRAVDGLQHWQAHRVPGITVLPENTAITPDAIVVVTLGVSFLALAAPCRIIGVVDEPTRWGFAYGTLPGHPEQGEEAFVVSIDAEGIVRFEVNVFSRPSDPIVKLSGPIGRSVQRWGTNGYLNALERYVANPNASPR